VGYQKLEDGYELNLTRGFVGTPDPKYPPGLCRGLGSEKRTYVETVIVLSGPTVTSYPKTIGSLRH